MVPPRRRLAQQVSYRESESELDDGQDDSFAESKEEGIKKSRPRQNRRKSPPVRGSNNAARTRRQPRKTYTENFTERENDSDFSSDERMDIDDDVAAVEKRNLRPTTSKPRGRPARRTTAFPRKPPQKQEYVAPPPPRRRLVAEPKHRGLSQADLWFMGAPCAWAELPFDILRDILSYASYPLFDDKGSSTPHVQWLLKFRSIHPALLEASQAVLYFCPPITSGSTAHQFLSLMSHTNNRTMNYNVKVKHLELEVRSTLAYSAGAELGPFDLGTLVERLPLLIGIDTWSILDNPEIRRSATTSRAWSYPNSLFEALADGPQRLRHFHWNSRFLAKQSSIPSAMYQWMRSMHLLPSFQSLTYLKLTSFLGDSEIRMDLHFSVDFFSPSKPFTVAQQNKEAIRMEKKAAQRREDELLAQALKVLPNLRKLDLHLCSVVDGDWLQLLPKELTHLGIIECDGLTSEGFEEFLNTHGQHLKVLVLNHNSALNITFLKTLAVDCPVLEELVMDLTYFRKLATVDDHEGPDYESLLLPDEKPTWPKTLQTISMNHLHHWGSSAAELFFTSLIESAEQLPDLRRLLLSVSLDVSWRERAKMRDMWEDKFKRVFLRKETPPNPNWWSLRAFREWKEKKVAEVVISPPRPGGNVIVAELVEETATDEDSDMPSRKRKAPTNAAPTRRLRPRKTTSDEDDAPVAMLGGTLRDMVMQTLETYIQGMCDEVDVRIDNLRPREDQFHESDFLDSELSGDEEWDEGRGDLDDDELYPRKKGRPKYAW